MPKYVIERDLPGAGRLPKAELKAISEKSVGILRDLGPAIQWVQSYVVDNKIYCIYHARDVDIIKRHAECGGFPANKISEIRAIIDPATAEA